MIKKIITCTVILLSIFILTFLYKETKKTDVDSKHAIPLSIFTPSTEEEKFKRLAASAKNEGFDFELTLLPGDGVEYYKKIEILLASGDRTDLIPISNPSQQYKYQEAGWLLPLDGMMKKKNYDPYKAFGKYINKVNGNTYLLPYNAGGWVVFYNKKIFDDAGVAYPKGRWTWSEYIETARRLNNPQKGIYGSYMLDYDNYFYFLARQKNIPGYKGDGTSNFDHPAFKEAMKFFVDLGNVHKIQPSWFEFKTKKLSWDGFMSGKYGMWFIGTWATELFTDMQSYPRNWEYGITLHPVPDSANRYYDFGVVSTFGINAKTRYMDESFDALRFIVENYYKTGGYFPVRADLTNQEFEDSLRNISQRSGGDVSVDELKDVTANNGLGYVDEKIVGPAMDEYNDIIIEEGERYAIGGQSLEDAVRNIKKRADKAIQNKR